MKKIKFLFCLIIAISLVFTFAGCGGGNQDAVTTEDGGGDTSQEVFTWKVQTAYTPASKSTMVLELWMETIEQITDGRLTFEVYQPGALCSVNDIVTFLEQGAFDVGRSYGAYYSGIIPEADIEAGLPFGWTNESELYDVMENRGLGDIIREAYSEHNIAWFCTPADPRNGYLTTFPINTVEDFRGKKIRAIGLYGELTEAFGASPVNLPAGELYQAIQLGTIDGTIIGWSALEDNVLHEVITYNNYPIMAQVTGNLLINQDSLNALPEDLRAMVYNATKSICYFGGLKYSSNVLNMISQYENEGKIIPVQLPEEEVAKMRAAAVDLYDSLAAKSPRMAEAVDIVKQFTADKGRPIE